MIRARRRVRHTARSGDRAKELPVRITESILIDRPPSAVWAVVVDLESHPRWRPALLEFRQVSEGLLTVGSRIHEVIRWRGRSIALEDEVSAIEPERRLGIRGGWKAADFELNLLLEASGSGTAVTFDWTFQPKSLLMHVAAPLLKGTLERVTAEELEGLRTYVTAGP
jgi:uncharacterized protein YndB with AHSA1/START domain